MSGIIKGSDTPRIGSIKRLPQISRPESVPSRATPPNQPSLKGTAEVEQISPCATAEAARAEALDRHCMELETTIAELRHKLRQAETDAVAREKAALEKGRNEALSESETHELKRLESLDKTLAAMSRKLDGKLEDLDLLSLQLARTALGRILPDGERHPELVEGSLDLQLSRLQRELVVSVRVSAADFATPEYLCTIPERYPAIAFQPDETLNSGESVIELQLGEIRLSMADQWKKLTAYFDEIAAKEIQQ